MKKKPLSLVKSEDVAPYSATPAAPTEFDAPLIARALASMEATLATRNEEPILESPTIVESWLRLRFAACEHEIFSVMLLDNRHRLIALRDLFRGTIDGASVHPREVVKEVIAANAGAVIFVHNHPSGNPEPSQADISITKRLKEALALIDVRTLDHFIVGGSRVVSFAARGLL